MKRAFNEGLLSIGAIAVILFTLVAIDDRVREQVWLRLSSAPAAQLSAAGTNLRDLGEVVLEAARDQSVEHAPLLIFGLSATVLVLFMLRT
ncbi:MAG: hypothetical protein IT176_05505 [Acidobacteria bacterium]|nr:hypothetical protein [Acidobacteriota bacterium]